MKLFIAIQLNYLQIYLELKVVWEQIFLSKGKNLV